MSGLAGALSRMLTDRATVYTRDPATQRFTVVEQTGVPCRLSTVSTSAAMAAIDRGLRAPEKRLYLRPDAALPEVCQIAVAGDPERWQVLPRQTVRYRDRSPAALYVRADLIVTEVPA